MKLYIVQYGFQWEGQSILGIWDNPNRAIYECDMLDLEVGGYSVADGDWATVTEFTLNDKESGLVIHRRTLDDD